MLWALYLVSVQILIGVLGFVVLFWLVVLVRRTQNFAVPTGIWVTYNLLLALYSFGFHFEALFIVGCIAGIPAYIVFRLISLDPDDLIKAIILSAAGFVVIPMALFFLVQAMEPDVGKPIEIVPVKNNNTSNTTP